MANQNDPWTKRIAVICLAAIAIFCLHKGIDHTILTLISGIIGGIAGYTIKANNILDKIIGQVRKLFNRKNF